MQIRKLTASLLALCVTALIIGMCLKDWHCENLFEHCTEEGAEDRDAMLSVTAMLLLGAVLLFVVFLMDVVLLSKKVVPSGLIAARFVLIYLGAALVFIAVVVYTAVRNVLWGYFLCVFAASIAIVLAMLAVASSRCVSSSQRSAVQH